jgi:protein-S-isoprenylcysteine O-methyltransferase Ste14
MVTTILAYLLIALFFVIESRARIGQVAKSLDRTLFDRGSTFTLVAAYLLTVLGLIAAPVLNYMQIGRLPYGPLVGWIGIVIALAGIALRIWAYRTLGRFYTRTLRVSENQHVVREGAYKLIRHPGYGGVILMWLGAALAMMNGITVAVASAALLAAYHYRIQTEERMLLAEMAGEYGDYRAHTRKLIPFLY